MRGVLQVRAGIAALDAGRGKFTIVERDAPPPQQPYEELRCSPVTVRRREPRRLGFRLRPSRPRGHLLERRVAAARAAAQLGRRLCGRARTHAYVYMCTCAYVQVPNSADALGFTTHVYIPYTTYHIGAQLGGRARLHDARLPRAPAVRAAAAAHAVRPLAAALQGALPARRARRGRGAGRGGPRGHASVRGPSRPLPRRVRGRLAQQGHGVARLVAARPGGVVARRPPPAAEVRARAHARTPRPPRRVRQPPPPRVGAGTRACGGRRCPRR